MSATFDLRDYPEQVSGLLNKISELKSFREDSDVIFLFKNFNFFILIFFI
jgi:hypothetical protein